jgi:hypothetical protein
MAQADYAINYKNIAVKVSDGSVITGKINIMNFTRVSEYFKAERDRFITVVSEGIEGVPQKATIINKEHIVLAETWD